MVGTTITRNLRPARLFECRELCFELAPRDRVQDAGGISDARERWHRERAIG